MKAPKSQRIGKKIPKKNIHPCLFLSVISPSVNATIRYSKMPPIPIAQYIWALLQMVAPDRADLQPNTTRRARLAGEDSEPKGTTQPITLSPGSELSLDEPSGAGPDARAAWLVGLDA